MRSSNRIHLLVCPVVALAALLLSAAARQHAPAKAEQSQEMQPLIPSVKGPALFRAYCASCHGADGKGGGPVVPALRSKPPDLTTIARRNGGVFPASRIQNIIAGDQVITAHGSREMPIWGPIFHQVERDQDWGEVRLHNVTKYLELMQEK